MRKYIVGAIFGALLSFSISANAEEIKSLIGKAIEGQFVVKLNDKELENQAIVVDGTSYLPVRAIGEALNLEVGFSADLGITLKSIPKPTPQREDQPQVSEPTFPQIPLTPYDVSKYIGNTGNQELNDVNALLQGSYSVLISYQTQYNSEQASLAKETDLVKKAGHEEQIERAMKSIKLQEANISRLEAKKSQLEAQVGTP